MSLRRRLAALERSCFHIAVQWDGLPPRPPVERARDVCDALDREPGSAPRGVDVATVRAALADPDATRAADAAEVFLKHCVQHHGGAAVDIELENELRRHGPGAEEAVNEIWRGWKRRRAR
jgi:hypothetical protein